MGRLVEGSSLLVAAVRVAYDEEIRYPAAALAYYAFVSFVPLHLLVFIVLGEQFATVISEVVPRFLTPEVRLLVNRSLTTASGRTGAGLLAVLVLVWSSGNLVGDIRTVIERIEKPGKGTRRPWTRDAVVILGSLGAAILVIVITSILFVFPPAGLIIGLVGFLGLWLTLAVAFVPLYYVPSTVVSSPMAAFPGAAIVSFGWTVLHIVVQFYTGNAGQYAIYGVLSGVIIILTSLYFAAAILLTGYIINALLIHRPLRRGP